MKRTRKILSVLLAVVLAFSTVSAALVAGAADYSKVKDFRLNAEESATILLDYVDGMLDNLAKTSDNGAKLEYSINLGVTKIELLIDYSSIDSALSTVYSLLDRYKSVLRLAGDAGDLKYSMLKGVQRSGGDLNVVYALLDLLNANSGLLVKAISGKLDLGVANPFFNVNDELSKLIKNLTDQQASNVTELIRYYLYDFMLGGKLGYPEKMSDSGLSTADAMINAFINAYLTTDKTTDFNGKALLPSLNGKLAIDSGSVYDLLETALEAGYKDLAVTPFNNDLKAIIGQHVLGGTKTDITAVVTDEQKALLASGENNPETALTGSGIALVDNAYLFRSGNTYSRIDLSGANDLAKIFDLNYALPAEIDLAAEDGTITSNVNHLLGVVVNTLLNDEYEAIVNWQDGGNELLVDNVANTAKVVLPLCPDSFFSGLDAETIAKIKNPGDLQPKELVNYFVNVLVRVLLPQLGDSLADADSFIEVGAVIANYYGKRVSSTIDYSDQIYVDGKIANKTDDEWVSMLLDLGTEVAVYYLDLHTNFDVDKDKMSTYKTAAAAAGTSLADFLIDDVVDWALAYANGVIAAGDNLAGERGVYDKNGGWEKFNQVINSVLPLSFLNDAQGSSSYAMDAQYMFKEKILRNLLNLDIADAINVFAKNDNAGNILNDTPVTAILKVVRSLINAIFPNAISDRYLSSAESLISVNSLGSIITNLLSAINSRKTLIIPALLPIVLSFMDDFVDDSALVLHSDYNAEAGSVTLTTVLSQKYAENFGVEAGVASGLPATVTIRKVGTLLAGDSYMKANGLKTLTLNDADDRNVYNVETYKIYNSNATAENDGYYTFAARVSGINALDADKEIYAISYLTYTVGGVENTVYSVNGYSIHLDVAD